MGDKSQLLQSRVKDAYLSHLPLRIVGGDTKQFYGNASEGETISMADHRGIVDYDPRELVITVRAGTQLEDLRRILA